MEHPTRLAILSLLLLCGAVEAPAEVVVVVSKNSPIESLSRQEINNIFLGNTATLPKVGKIVPFDRGDEKLRSEFYQDFTGRDLPQIKSHWAKIIFTGRGYPPKTVNSIDELKDALQRNPNAISYVTADKIDDSLKVLSVN